MNRTLTLFLLLALGVAGIVGLQSLGVLPPIARLSDSPDDSLESAHIIFFEKEDCSRCRNMKKSLAQFLQDYPDVTYVLYDVEADAELLLRLQEHHGIADAREIYPVMFIGDDVIVGEGRLEELALRSAMASCQSEGCPPPASLLNR